MDGQNPNLMNKILWGALLNSQFIFLYITPNFIARPKENSLPIETVDNTYFIFMGLAFVFAIASWFANNFANKQETNEKYSQMKILNYSLCEAVTIMGIVGVVLGMPINYFNYFSAAGIALMVFFFPKKNFDV